MLKHARLSWQKVRQITKTTLDFKHKLYYYVTIMADARVDQFPLAAGEVTAIQDDFVIVTEAIRGETTGFFLAGDDDDGVLRTLVDEYTGKPDAILYALVHDQETNTVSRHALELTEAVRFLQASMPGAMNMVEMVTGGTRELEVAADLTPQRTKIGDRLGIWLGNKIKPADDKTEGGIGKMIVTSVEKLTK